tara:strand:- start:11605 stop:12432 length:828 start_codon:yes stop_codon:yes gene_type:complete
MPSFSRHDIDSLAFKAVKDLNAGETLHNSVVKLAKDNSMNPEQIKRLVEATNTSAFLDKFNSKTGSDRMVEFKVADPSQVINEALGSSSNNHSATSGPSITISISTDSDHSLGDSVMDEVRSLPEEKVASDSYPTEGFFLHTKEASELTHHNKLQAKDSLLTKIASCNYQAEDLANAIHASFRGIYNRQKYASFELDALSTYGNSAIPGLQMVRNRLGLKKFARALTDQEKFYLTDRHVVDSTNSDSLSKLAEVIEVTSTLDGLQKSLNYLNRRL